MEHIKAHLSEYLFMGYILVVVFLFALNILLRTSNDEKLIEIEESYKKK